MTVLSLLPRFAVMGAMLAVAPGHASAATPPSLPAGLHATMYTSGLNHPTAMTFGPDRHLYITEENGTVIAQGSDTWTPIASVSGTALGLAWHGGRLYVSSTGMVTMLTPARGYGSFRKKVILSGLPTGRHENDSIVFKGGWAYMGIGSTCDACVESDPRSASIVRFRSDGSHLQVYARGLRDPYGLAIRPATGDLYATDNGRDDFGNAVPDELNRIVQGGRYGWPNCWGWGGGSGCAGTIAPAALFPAHCSADGMTFARGKALPAAYRRDAFVAEYGDTVNSLGTGHVVARVHFTGKRARVSPFAGGLTNPVAVTMTPRGALLVADIGTGVVWRIAATGH